MTSYLTRNQVLLQEIAQTALLQRGSIIGISENETKVSTLGSYHSQTLERTLFLALKEFRRDIEIEVLRSLSILEVIAERFPHLRDELPTIYGLLKNRLGKPIGVITEDFSEGRRYKVDDVADKLFGAKYPHLVPHELQSLTGKESELFDLASVAFLVNGKRRLGDFNLILQGMTANERLERFPISDIYDNLDSHTLRINYDI